MLAFRILAGLVVVCALSHTQTIDPRDRDFWNKKFSDSPNAFNHAPSRLLTEAIRDRKPGTAIDLGMGEGRNALYLAQQGWQVTGVDIADAGINQAKKRAAEKGLKLNAVVDSLDHYDLGSERWDLITLFYMHAWYRGTKSASVERLHRGLKPGGLLVIEGFAGREKYMFQPNELLGDFGDLRVLRYEDLQAEADWAPGHQSHIIRLVVEKTQNH